MRRRPQQKGSAILEFTLVGIAIIFVLISIFEVSRGLWMYHTLAYAVREGVRYAVMHGSDCASPNTCQVTIGQIVGVMQSAGGGVDGGNTTLTFTPSSGTATSGTLTSLESSTTIFPPSGANAPGTSLTISANYRFRTILAMFWAGTPPLNDSQVFHLKAASSELIQF